MRTQITRGRGKLYPVDGEEFAVAISYQVHEEFASEPVYWWGEFTFREVVDIRDSGQYTIELEDGRRGRCYLKRLVNRVARGVPPRYVYHFTGTSPLE